MNWIDAYKELPKHRDKVIIYMGDYRTAIYDHSAACFRSNDNNGRKDFWVKRENELYWAALTPPNIIP